MEEDSRLSRIQKAAKTMTSLKLLRPRQFQDHTKLPMGLQTPAPNPSFVFTFPAAEGDKNKKEPHYKDA